MDCGKFLEIIAQRSIGRQHNMAGRELMLTILSQRPGEVDDLQFRCKLGRLVNPVKNQTLGDDNQRGFTDFSPLQSPGTSLFQ